MGHRRGRRGPWGRTWSGPEGTGEIVKGLDPKKPRARATPHLPDHSRPSSPPGNPPWAGWGRRLGQQLPLEHAAPRSRQRLLSGPSQRRVVGESPSPLRLSLLVGGVCGRAELVGSPGLPGQEAQAASLVSGYRLAADNPSWVETQRATAGRGGAQGEGQVPAPGGGLPSLALPHPAGGLWSPRARGPGAGGARGWGSARFLVGLPG